MPYSEPYMSDCHCVQNRATRGWRVSNALGERLGRGGKGTCHYQVQKPHLRQRQLSAAKYRAPAERFCGMR